MNKPDLRFPALTLPPASFPDPQPVRRLIVLIPESEVDSALTARKIWELANALKSRVQLLGLSKDAAHESRLRRQLVTLSAMVGDGNISVASKIEFGNNWLNAVKSEWRAGDVIACFAEQRTGFARKPLSQILESNLNATVYIFTGLYQRETRLRSSWMGESMAWVGSIGIILGFFWLQLELAQFPTDWAHTTLLYISLLAEAVSIWGWNSLFG
ncbi:MAG: hypothetical protein Q8L87_00715 [Anaerolineales bacterium]|nr:hypothetical protein [Anaerolineales bacterium]